MGSMKTSNSTSCKRCGNHKSAFRSSLAERTEQQRNITQKVQTMLGVFEEMRLENKCFFPDCNSSSRGLLKGVTLTPRNK